MPNEWIEQLCEATFECSCSTILELVEQIPEANAALANALTDWANNFRIDLVTDLIEKSTQLNERSRDMQVFSTPQDLDGVSPVATLLE
jgi:hypothetical protein